MMAAETALSLTTDEVVLLYALAGREVAECVFDRHVGAGIAGPHGEHWQAAFSTLAKLSDAVQAIQESNTTKEQ